jgi:hypothetical protein
MLNKKLWSCLVGCFIASSFIWNVDFAFKMSLPNFLAEYAFITLTTFHASLIIISSCVFTLSTIFLMQKMLHISCDEYTFWLIWPILLFVILTSIVANNLIYSIVLAAVPALTIILLSARISSKN